MLRSHASANRAIEKGALALAPIEFFPRGPGHFFCFCIGALVGSWGTLVVVFIWVSWHWFLLSTHRPISLWSCGSVRSIWSLWTTCFHIWASTTRCPVPVASSTNGFSHWTAVLIGLWLHPFPVSRDGGALGTQPSPRTSVFISSLASTTCTMRWFVFPHQDLWTCVRTMQIGHHGGAHSWPWASLGCPIWCMRRPPHIIRWISFRTRSPALKGSYVFSGTDLAWSWRRLLLIHQLWLVLLASMLALQVIPWLQTTLTSCSEFKLPGFDYAWYRIYICANLTYISSSCIDQYRRVAFELLTSGFQLGIWLCHLADRLCHARTFAQWCPNNFFRLSANVQQMQMWI